MNFPWCENCHLPRGVCNHLTTSPSKRPFILFEALEVVRLVRVCVVPVPVLVVATVVVLLKVTEVSVVVADVLAGPRKEDFIWPWATPCPQ